MCTIRRRATGCPRSQIQSSYRRRLKTGVSGRGWLNGPGVFGQRKKETPQKKAGIRRSGAAHAAPLQTFTGRPHDCKRGRSRGPSHRPRQRKRSYFGRYTPAQETTWYFPLALTSFQRAAEAPAAICCFWILALLHDGTPRCSSFSYIWGSFVDCPLFPGPFNYYSCTIFAQVLKYIYSIR